MAEMYFLSVLEAGSPKVKVLTGLVSSVASVLGLPPAPCVIPPHPPSLPWSPISAHSPWHLCVSRFPLLVRILLRLDGRPP